VRRDAAQSVPLRTFERLHADRAAQAREVIRGAHRFEGFHGAGETTGNFEAGGFGGVVFFSEKCSECPDMA
jgi:hypothetical protein